MRLYYNLKDSKERKLDEVTEAYLMAHWIKYSNYSLNDELFMKNNYTRNVLIYVHYSNTDFDRYFNSYPNPKKILYICILQQKNNTKNARKAEIFVLPSIKIIKNNFLLPYGLFLDIKIG